MNNLKLLNLLNIDYFKSRCEIKFVYTKKTLKYIMWKPLNTTRWYLLDYYEKLDLFEIGMIEYSDKNNYSVHYYSIFKNFEISIINDFLAYQPNANDMHYIFKNEDYQKALNEWIITNDFIIISNYS